MSALNHIGARCIDYPVDCNNPVQREVMEEIARLIQDGWKIQGGPYVIQSSPSNPTSVLKMQVLLVQE